MAMQVDDRFEDQVRTLEAEVASTMGVVNASLGRLVELVADALDEDLWGQWGIHSPAHWVGWQTGMTPSRAAGVVQLASRRDELPSAIAALVAGELSIDAAVAIGRRAPANHERSITELAKVMTMSQLRSSLKDYHYDAETEATKPKPREDDRSVSTGTDERGWWGKIRLPADEGKVVEQALRSSHEDLLEREQADTPEGDEVRKVTMADALVGVAESYLRQGEAAKPGSDRYQVMLHLSPAVGDDGTLILSAHLGVVLPDAVRRLLLCDCTLTPVWERDGTPISMGRRTRALPRRMRKAVEHRDQGCRIPGCGRRRGLHLHHIVHWEDGGATDTSNLLSLCGFHHRLHHQGQLPISGNADVDGGIEVLDPWGHVLDPSGTPITPARGATPAEAARAAGIEPGDYTHPLGERLDRRALTFNRNPEPGTEGPEPPDPDPPDPPGGTHQARDGDETITYGTPGWTEPEEPLPDWALPPSDPAPDG